MKPEMPPAVNIALLVLLNHIEPGFENCAAVVKLWLDGEWSDADQVDAAAGEEKA